MMLAVVLAQYDMLEPWYIEKKGPEEPMNFWLEYMIDSSDEIFECFCKCDAKRAKLIYIELREWPADEWKVNNGSSSCISTCFHMEPKPLIVLN